ncbi:protein localization to perinuclear region of cytoplasm [Desmophyllum pertusum]|uniref:Protein localization to perinuclear region of cytoplasm n=1 Tax=Desmophyllum pertusum TaxID=174260 RepID=A0A9W9YEJ5_9CNID|nr:protein localization to perinuclear region of cytoplasm [Desmophyllum pertusum]
MAKSYHLLAVLFVLLSYSVVAIGEDSKQIGRDCKPFPYSFFDSVPFLLDFVRWFAWFFSNLISAIYFVLNTVVITVCEIISNIFSCFKHAIKLVEYLGYCIRAILQVNYNFVSSIFAWLAKLGRFVVESTRYIADGILSVIVSAFRLILSFIRGIVSSIPTGFQRASASAKNTTGLLLYQSYLGWKIHVTNSHFSSHDCRNEHQSCDGVCCGVNLEHRRAGGRAFVYSHQLENYIQGVLAFFATLQTPSISRFKQMFTAHRGPSNEPLEEKESNLREELERERDKNLCVVCQTENKNIVVMPCRHMCMCKNCCTQLFRIQRHHRRTCPLCRHIITSTMEIYS